MIAATTTLAVFCLLLGLFPGVILPTLVGLAPGGAETAGLFAGDRVDSLLPWNLGVSLSGTGGLPTLFLALFLAALVGLLVLLRGRRRAPAAPVWTCGQRVERPLLWTSAAFTMSLRLALKGLLRPERTVGLEESGGVAQRLDYRSTVPHLFDRLLYRPAIRWSLAAATFARRLQSGSLRTYMAYLLALVIGVLAVAWLWS